VAAVRASNAGEPFVQIAALEKGRDRLLDDRSPEPVLRLIIDRRINYPGATSMAG